MHGRPSTSERGPGPHTWGMSSRPSRSATPRDDAFPRRRQDALAEARRQWLDRGLGEAESMAAATSLVRATQLVVGRIEAALRPLGLTFARYEVLQLLAFTRAGELPMGKIGERLLVHPTSVTNSVNRLEADGLVERERHPVDGRSLLARLTPAGRELAERATKALLAARFGLEDVTVEDLRRITRMVRRLREDLGDLDPAAEPRP